MLSPLVDRTTYRRWVCLIMGGALLMPYMMAGSIIGEVLRLTDGSFSPVGIVQPPVFAAVLPLVAASGLVLPIRTLETAAARGLLGAAIDLPPGLDSRPAGFAGRTWDERRRTAAWYTLHLGVGGVMSGLTLALVPFAIWAVLLPVTGDPIHVADAYGLSAVRGVWWGGPLLGIGSLVILVYLVAAAGALLAKAAPALLGPSPAQRLAALEEHARKLVARNRLARELHDSVGHALNIVTVQAAAAARTLDRDPEAARTALGAIEETARTALEELDHVLGVLRESSATPDEAAHPMKTLADLPDLERTTGIRADVCGDLASVPASVSREGYRIVQESLTNALRHGTGPAGLTLTVEDGYLQIAVRNSASAPSRTTRTGLGLSGIRERVTLLGGQAEAGRIGDEWHVSVRLPFHHRH
ncbi:sensor histidine kinase [Rhizohabitans arisaemae]|uniref:sensor histidine kinase n=1 Tax=Rhizohabitans arisaemae TaxID=2720610 RepID=UPI0024B1B601|nr:histidine kinase [Rhizohabitans arisaemae]